MQNDISKKLYNNFPKLVSKDLILSELSGGDAENYLQYISRPEVSQYISDDNVPSNLAESKIELRYWISLFHNQQGIYWGIYKNLEPNRLIGTIGFNMILLHHLRAEISYDLDPEFWGQGFASEAVNEVLAFVDSLGIIRVQATSHVDNIRSMKLLDKKGFIREGRLNKYEMINGKLHDYYMYSRII